MIRLLTLVFFLGLGSFLFAQTDSTFFSYPQLMSVVKDHHPIMVQAGLFDQKSQAYQLKARGYFDPKIDFGFSSKDFDKKDYYQLINGVLKIPTWIGADVKIAYENNRGQFLDNSDFLPDAGLIAAGISIPLGRGLFFDERRKAIKTAEIYEQSNEVKRQLLLNDLFYSASLAYTKWQQAYNILLIRQEGLELAKRRFQIVNKSFINGDKPAIDTLESFIAVQTRTSELIKAKQKLNYNRQALNTFIWLNGELPLDLDSTAIPVSLQVDFFQSQSDSIFQLKENILATHPELIKYELARNQLQLDQRLNRENLKPSVNLNYNPLIRLDDNNALNELVTENYKLGVDVAYPIFTRKERANIRLTDIEIQDNDIQRRLKSQRINIKLNTLFENGDLLNQQEQVLAETSSNYNRLLDAEYKKLSIGESSVFLVNSREMKYLEFKKKLIDVRTQIIQNDIQLIRESVFSLKR